MSLNVTSLVTLLIIAVMIVVAIGFVLSLIWRLLSPLIADNKSFWRAMRSLNWRVRYLRRRRIARSVRGDDDDEDDDDELDSTTLRVLSTLDAATIVVDDDDEVQRASSSTYRWGLVHDDEVVNEEILSAIVRVRQGKGRQKLDIVTTTAPDFMGDAIEDENVSEIATRPYWLSVVVRSISDHLILILVTDKSEEKRFAQTRDDFVSNVAEQLLEPTAQIESVGTRIEQDASQGEIRADGHIVASNARHLNKLVADLMLLIRAQEKVIPSQKNRLDLGRLVSDVCDKAILSRGVKIHTRFADGIIVNGASDQLQAAVNKLVANAIHYTKDNGVVTVVADKANDEKFAVVRVIDTGVGIAKSEQEHIFERFYRGSNQPMDTDDGVGLGLSIVKHVALTHHGTVTVWSAPGQGSTFSLFIPLATK